MHRYVMSSNPDLGLSLESITPVNAVRNTTLIAAHSNSVGNIHSILQHIFNRKALGSRDDVKRSFKLNHGVQLNFYIECNIKNKN